MILHLLLLMMILIIIAGSYQWYQRKYVKPSFFTGENKEGTYPLKDGLVFDSVKHLLYDEKKSSSYKLNNQQAILLKLLLDADHHKLQAWDAVYGIWGDNGHIDNLYPLISRLRSKLKQVGSSIQILAIENGQYHLFF